MPTFWGHGNPIDILGDATAQRYGQVTNCCFEAESVDGMLVIVNAQAMTDPTEVAETLSKDLKGKPYPVFAAMMGGLDVEAGRTILNKTGIPTYDTPERAIRSFAVLYDYARNLELLQEIPSRSGDVAKQGSEARALMDSALAGKNAFMEEAESKRLLACYGIPVNRTEVAESMDEALRLAADMGYPLVMKILSPDIVHKTEARGIRTDLGSKQEVRDAYDKVINAARNYDPAAEICGVTLQPMV
ncbi:conserved domain protein [delta proteobacterium NaphS2]|nr:conserved domain protein [delta proteobacterium NaphS2]